MHYRLSANMPLQAVVPAIAANQLDAAVARLRYADHGHTAIHCARKHFKRARALLGLVEPAAPGKNLKASRKLITSAAHMLASSRDAQVAIDAAQDLVKEFGAGRNARAFSDLTSFLIARRDRVEEKLNRAGIDAVLGELEKAKDSLSKLDLRRAKMSDLLDSACATYRKGRHAMKDALKTGGDEAIHSWRKLAQQHWRHMLLLKDAWPKEAKARVAQARRLSGVLGQHNDLAVMREIILTNRIVFRSPDDVKMLCRCIEKKQAQFLSEADSEGGRLYAEKPKAFGKRLDAHWHSAKRKSGTAEARA
ncbi:MAG: CHAD domain-containing protein [Rhodomicrobium sp.]